MAFGNSVSPASKWSYPRSFYVSKFERTKNNICLRTKNFKMERYGIMNNKIADAVLDRTSYNASIR